MSNIYNKNARYNAHGYEGALTYNGAVITYLVSIIDTINVSDAIGLQEVLNLFGDSVIVDDATRLAEARLDVFDQINMQDGTSVAAFLDILDDIGISDVLSTFAHIPVSDSVEITDGIPRVAESDFYIGGAEDRDPRKKWFMPFDTFLSPVESEIQIMPSTESTYIDLPNVDGTVIKDTLYTNRFFNIVSYSMQGLSVTQLNEMKSHIAELLDRTRNESQQLSIQENDMTFDVKYSGGAEVREGHGWLRATVPFEVSPYGKTLFSEQFYGDGTITNTGAKPIGAIFTLSAGCVNPNFTVGTLEFLWEGTVPEGYKLIIDADKSICYLIDGFGNRINAITDLTKGGEFFKLNLNESAKLTCLNSSTLASIVTDYSPMYLWGKEFSE